jgi:excisionase family DNA binding protein
MEVTRMQETNKIEPLVSVKRAAELLGMQPAHVYRLASTRRLPSYRLGALRRFRESEILEFIEKNRVRGAV